MNLDPDKPPVCAYCEQPIYWGQVHMTLAEGSYHEKCYDQMMAHRAHNDVYWSLWLAKHPEAIKPKEEPLW